MKYSAILILVFVVGCASPVKSDRDNTTAPFDGERFSNIDPFERRTFRDMMKWRFTSNKTKWPDWIHSTPKQVPHQRFDGLSVTYINHATTLIQINGVNILTDPFFSMRTSPVQWAGPKRVRRPGVEMEDLPPVDIILISHNHYDHMDKPALKQLAVMFPEALVLTGLGNMPDIKETGFTNITEMDWWESLVTSGLTMYYVPARHFSARTYRDAFTALWGGFVIESPDKKVYFAGDTGKGSHDKQLAEKFGGFDVSLIPIGAYEPRWFMAQTHLNPAEAVQVHRETNSKFSIGIHFGTVQLTDEGIDEPVIALKKALVESGIPESEFIAPDFGETYIIAE
jgi:L-ascorbate metabolism protein UlaG (beta-lactamase superfamily)